MFFYGRLVDSRDIVELKLKQLNCEVTIRKKEALPQPEYAPPPAVTYSPQLQAAPPVAPSYTQAPPTPSPSTSLVAVKSSKPSHPPLKSPMAGTFYRSPAPGEPPFVKVDLPFNYILLFFVYCILAAVYESTLSLGWRQSKQGPSIVHH